jgi:hypothetical protein
MIPRWMSAVAIILTLSNGLLLSGQSSATKRLLQLLETPGFQRQHNAVTELIRVAIDAGPAAVPDLRNLLKRSTYLGERSLVVAALSFIGGSEAVSTLQKEYDGGNLGDAEALAFALASVASKENREMLNRLLKKDPADEPQVVEAATFSLGLLRAREAIPRLRVLARGPSNRDTTEAAKRALKWIEQGFSLVKPGPDDNRQRVLAAVLKVGVPYGNYNYLYDRQEPAFWSNSPAGWTFSKGKPQDLSSTVDDVFISPDDSRAFVSVGTFSGPRCGAGYAYLLRKEASGWRVYRLTRLWIA